MPRIVRIHCNFENYNHLINQILIGEESGKLEKCILKLKISFLFGNFSEKTVIEYAETLTTATNSRINAQINEIPKPHPCAKPFCSFTARDLDNDYECIINCCQRHVCRLLGYCKSSKKVNQYRFGYPLELQENTKIIFNETKHTVR